MAENTAALLDKLINIMRHNDSLHTQAVEAAFRGVPRHIFLPDEPLEKVYSDVAIAVKRAEEGEWTSSSSQPSMMAIMLEQLDLRPGMRVLEIGTGSGYNAALMAALVGPSGSVVTVDIQPDLIENAKRSLQTAQALLGARLAPILAAAGDGGIGYPPGAPFDRIILTVSSWVITQAWREQLVDGGLLVLPLSLNGPQKSIAFEKQGETLISRSLSDCGFMSLQGAFAEPPPRRLAVDAQGLLTLSAQNDLPADASQFAAWLRAPGERLSSGVQLRPWEIWGALYLWLSLHRAGTWARLTASGDLAGREDIPGLIGSGGEMQMMETLLLLTATGAGVLVPAAGERVQLVDWNRPADERPPEQSITLDILQLGPDPQPAQQLARLIAEWHAAGQPGSRQLRVRAVPAGVDPRLEPGEYLLERPSTNLVLDYS